MEAKVKETEAGTIKNGEEEEKVERTDAQEVGDNDLGALYAEMLQLFFLIFLLNDAEPFSFV